MKKVLSFLLVISMVFSLTGCSEEAASGQTASSDSLVSQPSESQIDSDADSQTSSIDSQIFATDSQASSDSVEEGVGEPVYGQWPDNSYTALVPKPDAGEVWVAEVSDSLCMVVMSWTIEEAQDYVQKLKDVGFTEEMSDNLVDGGVFYGKNEEGTGVLIQYANENDSVIQIVKGLN